MTLRRTLPLLVLMLAIVSDGCGFLRPQQKRYYSLETIPPQTPPVALGGLPIGIDAVELPPSIDRREIAVREANQRLDLRGTELWSAPLEAMVIHTLAFDLAGRLPEGMIVLPGQGKPVGVMRSIYVVVEEFGAGPDPVLVLDARWILRNPGVADSIRHERIDVPIGSLDSAQIASAMSRALATLADRMAAALSVQ
jgi:uncharacterized lipoprotein YmbA